jgi:protein kinase A
LIELKETGQFCALKVLQKEKILKMRQLEHTQNERAVLGQLNHPFLITMVASFQDVENVYFILEYVQGGELFSYLRKSEVFTFFI